MPTVTIPNRPSGSDTRSIAAILANFDAITDVLNGQLDAVNIADQAITVAKTGRSGSGLAQYSFAGHRATNISGQNRGDAIPFDAETWDPSGSFAHTTGIFTVPIAGLYLLTGHARFVNPTAGEAFYLRFRVGSTHVASGSSFIPSNGNDGGSTITAVKSLAVGQQVVMDYMRNTASSTALGGGTNGEWTFFAGHLLGRS